MPSEPAIITFIAIDIYKTNISITYTYIYTNIYIYVSPMFVFVVVVVVEVYHHTFFAFLTLILFGGERSATCGNCLALY